MTDLLVLYSGHGENKNNIGSWIPVDAKHFPQYLGEHRTRLSGLGSSSRTYPGHRRSVLPVASSRSPATPKRRNTPEKFRSRYALTAGRDEPVLDGQPGQNSPFAEELKFILSTLRKAPLARWGTGGLGRQPGAPQNRGRPDSAPRGLICRAMSTGSFFFHPKNLEATIEQERFKRMEAEKARDYARQKEQEARETLEKLQLKEAELKEALGEAAAQARRIYANQLAYNSQRALRAGDRTTAFRLAEFAHYYLDNNNSAVASALVEAITFMTIPGSSVVYPGITTLAYTQVAS